MTTAPVAAAARPEAAIRTRGLRRTFGDHVAVHGLDLAVPRGQVFGLLGPNGSGKTTTIRMLCGLLRPTGGEATVVGHDVARDADALRRSIGYMSQRFGLYPDLTVAENLRFYAALYGVSGDAGRARCEAVLDELGLAERRGQAVGQLSGGWKQRVALACATAHRPALLFLDEPTAGVDPAARRRFWQTIYALARGGTTVVVTTHYMDEAARCERVAFLSRGRLIAAGTPDEVTAQFGQPTIEDVLVELQRRDEGVAA